jgi:hypothetical protein
MLHGRYADCRFPKGGDRVWGRRNHPAPDFNASETTKVRPTRASRAAHAARAAAPPRRRAATAQTRAEAPPPADSFVRKAVLASNMVMFDGRGKTTEETIKALLDAARSGPERDGRLANYGTPARSPPAPAQGAARHLPSPRRLIVRRAVVEEWHSHGLRDTPFSEGEAADQDSRSWANPLEARLLSFLTPAVHPLLRPAAACPCEHPRRPLIAVGVGGALWAGAPAKRP